MVVLLCNTGHGCRRPHGELAGATIAGALSVVADVEEHWDIHTVYKFVLRCYAHRIQVIDEA
jgi:hypothetical protein